MYRLMMARFSSTVPPTGVYFVKSASIAACAAALTAAGVGTSGSPAPRSSTCTPSRRRRSTAAVTFIVGDEAMRELRLASWVMRDENDVRLARAPQVFGGAALPPCPERAHEHGRRV